MHRLALVLLALALLAGVALAAEDPVANVAAIQGKLTVMRGTSPQWFAAFVQMPDYLSDHLKTDATSVAAIEFKVGGKIGINKGTEIEIVGARDARDVTKRSTVEALVLKSGTIWAKFTRQHEPFRIQTESTVIGIRGTEFTVTSGADGQTTVSVLEGEVEYQKRNPDGTLAAAELARSGMQVRLALQGLPSVVRKDPMKLRQELQSLFPALDNMVKQALEQAQNAVRQAQSAADVVNDANARTNEAMARTNDALGRLGRIGIGGLPGTAGGGSGAPDRGPAPLDHPAGLTPFQASVKAADVAFTWEPVNGAAGYVVLLARDPRMALLDWTTQVTSPTAAYPRDGLPLEPGVRYYWRITAVDAAGAPVGRPSQSWFTVEQ